MNPEIKSLLKSYRCKPQNTTEAILSWIAEKNENLRVSIVKNKLSDSPNWFYDDVAVRYAIKITASFRSAVCAITRTAFW